MVGLGDLPGGTVGSSAKGVSADGSVVVGQSDSASGEEAFRWTSTGGMVALGDLPGGSFDSSAHGVSADGSVVLGYGNSASGREAFIWDATNGMRNLKDVLVNDHGLDLTGWTPAAAKISSDSLTIVGSGQNPSGDTEGWIASLAPSGPPPDSDGDGLLDSWETRDLDPDTGGVQNPFNPLAPDSTGDSFQDTPDGIRDGLNDWDGDGMSNADEFRFGYDPIDPMSWGEVPALTFIGAVALALLVVTAAKRIMDCPTRDRNQEGLDG